MSDVKLEYEFTFWQTLGKGMGHANINNTDKYLSFRETELVGAIHKVFGG